MRHLLLTTTVILVGASVCVAQSRNSGSGRGNSSFGSSGFGSSMGGFGGGFGNSGFGSSGFGSSGLGGFGQSGFGQSGFGQSGFGQTGFGQTGSNGFGNINRSGATGIGSQFNRGATNRGAGTGFVGTNQRGQGGQFSGNQSMNPLGMTGASATQVPGMARYSVLQIGFEAPQVPPAAIVEQATISLNPSNLPSARNVEVTVEGEGVGVLRGEVSTVEEARRAAALLSLEPGIRSVRNEMTVREAE